MEKELIRLLDAEGRIVHWPKKKAEKLLILKHLQAKLDTHRTYNEKEINAIINKWHLFHDHALLRREMFDNYLISRTKDGGEYWVEGKRPL